MALFSGFSNNLLTLFLDNEEQVMDDDLNPEQFMEAAISGEKYQKLVVLD